MAHEKTVFLLGGQGTQYFGMARSLLESDDVFRSTMHDIDRIVSARFGQSVLDYLYDPRRTAGERCDDLRLTFLGLYMVEYALARSLAARGIRPDLLVGSSLGEFIAVSVAGLVPPERFAGPLGDMADHVLATMPPGGMVAVLADHEVFDRVVRPSADLTMASVNNPRHFVISADRAALDRACRQMDAHGLVHRELPVNFAFHSPGADLPAAGLRAIGEAITVAEVPAGVDIFSSRTTGRLSSITADDYGRVIREPIRFTDAVRRIPDYRRHRYIDLSPSSTLTSILRSSLPETTSFPIITQFGDELRNIAQVLDADAARRVPTATGE